MSIDLLLAECLTLGVKGGVALPRLVEPSARDAREPEMTFTKRMPATLFRGDFAARFALALGTRTSGWPAIFDTARCADPAARPLSAECWRR